MIEASVNKIDNLRAVSSDYVFIIERSTENLRLVSNDNGNYIFEGICAIFGVVNDNNRLYEKDEYLPHLEYLNAKIAQRRLVGELDHPQNFDISLKNISHIVEKLWYNEADNSVRIRIRLLDTPHGKIAKSLVDSGIPLAISSRSAGQILQEGTVKLHRIFTYDLVAEPGFANAILEPTVSETLRQNYSAIHESLDTIKNTSIINKLESVNENFDNNVKIYKINKDDESFNEVLAKDVNTNQNNNNKMGGSISKKEFDAYSKTVQTEVGVIKETLQGVQKTLKNISVLKKKVNEEFEDIQGAQEPQDERAQAEVQPGEEAQGQVQEETTELPNITDEDDNASVVNKLVGYVDFLAKQLENVINHTNYVTEMLNKSIGYSENMGNNLNKHINFTNYLGKKVNEAINYTELIGEKTNESINYGEMVGDKLGDLINFADLLAQKTNEAINYADYGFKRLDEHIDYTNYLSSVMNNKTFASGKTTSIKDRQLDDNVTVITEGKENEGKVDKKTAHEDLSESIKKITTKVAENSNDAVLESKYPFLKLLNKEDKEVFYKMEDGVKREIIATLEAAVYFKREDVLGIINGIIEDKNAKMPTYIKYMPEDYKPIYEKMTDIEKVDIDRAAKSGIYKVNTPYQVKSFWDSMSLNAIKDRMISESAANEKLAENVNTNKENKEKDSQSTEGNMSINEVIQIQRGYNDNYVDAIKKHGARR